LLRLTPSRNRFVDPRRCLPSPSHSTADSKVRSRVRVCYRLAGPYRGWAYVSHFPELAMTTQTATICQKDLVFDEHIGLRELMLWRARRDLNPRPLPERALIRLALQVKSFSLLEPAALPG